MAGLPDSRSAPAFVTSCVFGTIGAVLLLTGLLSGSVALVLIATACGSFSLVAALVWRGQLIAAWQADRRRSAGGPNH